MTRTVWLLGRMILVLAMSFRGSASAQTAPGTGRPDTTATTGYLTSHDGTRIYYESRGEGRPVVLVHGFIVNSDSWKTSALYKRLLEDGFRVVLLDLRGNGKSDKPHTAQSYARDAEALDVMRLADELGLASYCAVGYSRGAIITARLLVLDPRIECAVLGGMGADFTNPEWPRRKLFYEALAGKPVKELEGLIRHIEESGLDRTALALMQKEQPSTSPEELSTVRKPVLVIAGDQDSDNGSAPELARLIPKAVHAAVPGNHGSTVRSEPFANEVIGFLTRP